MRDLKSGFQLASRYTLVRKLGAGRGADTWLATDRMTRASVALKILVDEKIGAETLRREWQLGIRLVHAHIARAFEFHGDAEIPFYSMQFVDGPDISILSGAPLADILPAIGLIAEALGYAHTRDVVHRDLKSANVMLDANGVPYLIDFGVASTGAESVGGGSLIAASPESLAGESPQSSDDIFAFGGLVYELISGRSPYSSASTADDICNRVPDTLRAASGETVPEVIVSLVAAMLDKDAAARPRAREIVDVLKSSGYPPGTVSRTYVSGVRVVEDEVIASDTAIRDFSRKAQAAAAHVQKDGTGMSLRAVGVAFAALIAILVGVVFVLPGIATNGGDVPEPAAEESESGDAESQTEDTAPQRDERVQARLDTEAVLGRLLARIRTLESRAVQRWGGLAYKQAQDAYDAGDTAYLERNYDLAQQKYAEAFDLLEPLVDRVDQVFETAMAGAEQAIVNGETADAVRLFELAVAISPSHGPALAGLARAKNLDEVLSLTEQGLALERDLELEAARESFERAIELDPEWEVAKTGLARVLATMNQLEFDQRMTEGLMALSERDYLAARAAFRMAQQLKPESREPADGLLQVDQGMRLQDISALEREAHSLENSERWESASEAYQRILELDDSLTFAQDGLGRSTRMIELHQQLDQYIDDPDSLSAPRTMQRATRLVVDITRMSDIGPRLAEQRDELSRLLKRAATPLTVQLVSDNLTEVSVYKVGKLGNFDTTELTLRPGTYVAVGSRPGYRDVRLEFRVAPEIEMRPVVVRCEEEI